MMEQCFLKNAINYCHNEYRLMMSGATFGEYMGKIFYQSLIILLYLINRLSDIGSFIY